MLIVPGPALVISCPLLVPIPAHYPPAYYHRAMLPPAPQGQVAHLYQHPLPQQGSTAKTQEEDETISEKVGLPGSLGIWGVGGGGVRAALLLLVCISPSRGPASAGSAPARAAHSITTPAHAASPHTRPSPLVPSPRPQLFFWLCLSICMHTIVLGLHEVFVLRSFTAWLALPCLWAVYNSVPPLLFFGFVFGSTGFFQILCFWAQVVQTLAGLGAVVMLWFIKPTPYS